MNYYQHHIGDFNNAARHLSLVERAIYRDLLDMYYDTEQAIDASNLDRLARRLQCNNEDQVAALKYILEEFFKLEGGLYVNNRCEREIVEFHTKRKQASEAGKTSAQKRAAKRQQEPSSSSPSEEPIPNGSATVVEEPFNEKSTDAQLTINHKPITINQSYSGSSVAQASQNLTPNIPIGFVVYRPDDHQRYSLLECVTQYPIHQDFIDFSEKRFTEVDRQDLITMFKNFGDWFVTSDTAAPCTPGVWLVKWLSWIQNNKDQIKRNREKQKRTPEPTTPSGNSKPQGYFEQMFAAQQNSNFIDVTPDIPVIGGHGHA